jgi:GT2 family glycosyltransferase
MTEAHPTSAPVVGRPATLPGRPLTTAGRATTTVTAVLVTRGASDYLPATLAATAAQTRPVDRLLVVDAAHDLTDEVAEAVQAMPASPLGGSRSPDVVGCPGAGTFGEAVKRALADRPPATSGDARSSEWVWLLHDDSTPEPGALAELLRSVEGSPSVAVAGCKQRTWSSPARVVEVGVATSRFGRRMTGIDEPEVDQGQHDGEEDVLAVGTAGALVRRDVWDQLGGTDPALGPSPATGWSSCHVP